MHPKMFTFFKVLYWNEETPTTCESPSLLQRISSGRETHASFPTPFPDFQFLNCGRTRRTPFLFETLAFQRSPLKNQSCGQRSVIIASAIFFFFFFNFFLTIFRLSLYSPLLVSWLASNIINYMHEMLRPTVDKFMINHYPTFRDTGKYSFFCNFFCNFFFVF